MNKIQKIIEDITALNISLPRDSYRLTANLEKAKDDQIVFYKLGAGEKAHEQFQKRAKDSNPALLILCTNKDIASSSLNLLCVDEKKFTKLQQQMVDHVYPAPSNVKLVGITGTNGKSSCVYLAAQIADSLGTRSFSLGTLGLRDAHGKELDSVGLTTPSFLDLRRMIWNLAQQEEQAVVFLEVSSHALMQDRLKGLALEYAGWTNFTQDHLDYHQTLDEYFKAKLRILEYTKNPLYYPAEEKQLEKKLREISSANLCAVARLKSDVLGAFAPVFKVGYNADNLSLSLALAEAITTKKVDYNTIKDIFLPPGRMNSLEVQERLFVIDYAHTPDAIKSILQGLKESFPEKALTIVFGCGGDRDKTKRPLMRQAAESIADKCIITSDNPRSEEPLQIIADIMSGSKEEHLCEADRREAIIKAYEQSQTGEIILIAGKGHEDYQELKTGKIPYSDLSVVEEIKKGYK